MTKNVSEVSSRLPGWTAPRCGIHASPVGRGRPLGAGRGVISVSGSTFVGVFTCVPALRLRPLPPFSEVRSNRLSLADVVQSGSVAECRPYGKFIRIRQKSEIATLVLVTPPRGRRQFSHSWTAPLSARRAITLHSPAHRAGSELQVRSQGPTARSIEFRNDASEQTTGPLALDFGRRPENQPDGPGYANHWPVGPKVALSN